MPIPGKEFVMPFRPSRALLVVGDGDFSWTRGLLSTKQFADHLAQSKGVNVIATNLPSREKVTRLYAGNGTGASSQQNIQWLEERGVLVLTGVNAAVPAVVTQIQRGNPDVLFDGIIFNFPHTTASNKFGTAKNQELLKSFFRECYPFLAVDGKFYVTLKQGAPYHEWDIKHQVQPRMVLPQP